MVRNSVKILAASLVAVGTITVPAVSSAQQAVAIECPQGQRAVMVQQRVNGRTQVIARCEDSYRGASGARPRRAGNGAYRPVASRASDVQYVGIEREPERSKTKTALMIGGAAATGAGVGGALKGTKGALIGAAVGGGAATIYEAVKRD
jgi:hypothetical protein